MIFLKVLGIILLNLLVYRRSLLNSYVIDDFTVYSSSTGRPKNNVNRFWLQLMGHGYWDDDKKKLFVNKQAHWQVIIGHTITSVLVYLCFGANDVSLLASVLFSINPINHEVSVWLSGKAYAHTTSMALIAWANPLFAPAIFLIPYGQVMYFTALCAPLTFLFLDGWYKLIALCVIPFLIVRYKQFFNPKNNPKLAFYVNSESCEVMNKIALDFKWVNLIRAIKFYGYYICNCIFSLSLAFYQKYMSEFVSTDKGVKESRTLDKYFFVGLLAIYIIVTNVAWNGWQSVFGLIWFTINIAMWCNFKVYGQQHTTSRYAYLANAGLMLFVASVLIHYPVISGVLIGWYLKNTFMVIKSYKNDYWHNHYAAVFEPEYYMTWMYIGNMHFSRCQFETAFQAYKEAQDLEPRHYKVFYNLSSASLAMLKIDEAILYLEEAKKCEMLGQESFKQSGIEEREALIVKIINARKSGRKLDLKVSDIPIII